MYKVDESLQALRVAVFVGILLLWRIGRKKFIAFSFVFSFCVV